MKPALDIPIPASSTSDANVSVADNGRLRSVVRCTLTVGLAVALPLILNDYYLYLATQVAIYAIATLGLDIVFGRTGQLSLSHASFFGLGAYSAALMANW